MRYVGGFRVDGRIERMQCPRAGNDLIRSSLETLQPVLIARHGVFELLAALAGASSDRASYQKCLGSLHLNAGFFPKDSSLIPEFSSIYLRSSESIDTLGISLYRHGHWKEEEAAFQQFCPSASLVDIRSLDGFLFEQPWTSALRGRKVLVVHPFAQSIKQQYDKRDLLFQNPDTLPKFASLQVIPAVQSIAGSKVSFESWFEALASMCSLIDKADFEVAIIGAGAYGLPLAAHVKTLGKQAVHAGGVTQLLFGIFGERWVDWYPDLPNEHWVRPADSERPAGLQRVESGCYW
jgi:hypothetical protein